MFNQLVKILKNDDGDEPMIIAWHLVDPCNAQGPAALCTGEFFGTGESEVVYEEKTVARGGITCEKCLEHLKMYKSVKL